MDSVIDEIRSSFHNLSIRGLHNACKWASELLCELEDNNNDSMNTTDIHTSNNIYNYQSCMQIENKVLLAKSYYELREYKRAAYVLIDCNSHIATFLRIYCIFLSGEKTKQQDIDENKDELIKIKIQNKELLKLKNELHNLYKQDIHTNEDGNEVDVMDGYLLYLYGLILKEVGNDDESRSVLIESVNKTPLNWSAWECLASQIDNIETLNNLLLPTHWMSQFFLAYIYSTLNIHEQYQIMEKIDEIQNDFNNSSFINTLLAKTHYNNREFDDAQMIFEELKLLDPYRLEHMDIYSNLLFVKEEKAALAYLAHESVLIDKYSPYTNVIIGNYYALKNMHEKAIIYFKRATILNSKYVAAWILMGQEYIEVRNTSAAIECLRKAVDIDGTDYRAWYNLGLTYELLQMDNYSIYYFQKAVKLRPYDPRMWCAMGERYEKINKVIDAVKCYLRADTCDQSNDEGISVNKLAKLYEKLGNNDMASVYYKRILNRKEQLEDEIQDDQETIDCLYFLGDYAKSKGDYEKAEEYYNRLLDIGGSTKEQAKVLLTEIRQLKKAVTI